MHVRDDKWAFSNASDLNLDENGIDPASPVVLIWGESIASGTFPDKLTESWIEIIPSPFRESPGEVVMRFVHNENELIKMEVRCEQEKRMFDKQQKAEKDRKNLQKQKKKGSHKTK